MHLLVYSPLKCMTNMPFSISCLQVFHVSSTCLLCTPLSCIGGPISPFKYKHFREDEPLQLASQSIPLQYNLILLISMSEPIPSPSPNILALPQETCIQLAINTITKAGSKPTGGQLLSTCSAADIYQVPHSTLGDHMKGL